MPRKSMVITTRELDIPIDRIEEYREAFNMFDINKDGLLSADEIFKMLKNYGYPMRKHEIKRMIAKIDMDGDEQINFEEFITLMQSQTIFIDETDDDALIRAFKSFDINQDGKIPNKEFKYIISHLGNAMSKIDVENVFKIANLNEDEQMDYMNFIEFWKKFRKQH